MKHFEDLFDASRYADEDPISIGIESEPVDDWLFVPAPIFDRVMAIGSAYGLHELARVAPEQVTRLDAVQCEALLKELAFVSEVLADPLVADVVRRIARLAAICTRSRDEHLVVDLED